ncbi:MAG: hypothetical protein ACYTFW_23940 [Planctomycetota bacterium]|jgi:hypothetical protein
MEKVLDIKDRKPTTDGVSIHGFFRLQIEDPDGSIVGDSGWCENTVTNDGKLQYIVRALASSAGSKYLSYAALGEGTEPGAAATSLESEVVGTQGSQIRDAMTMESSGSTALRCTGTFSSSDSFVTATESIANIGLFQSSTGGTIFAGNTFASSTCAVNQNVNYTYDITLT